MFRYELQNFPGIKQDFSQQEAQDSGMVLLPFQYLSGAPAKMVKFLPKLAKAMEFHPVICVAVLRPQAAERLHKQSQP